ncbi:MAG: hypothetical protein OES79_14180, partial [Planctomycetota bacterium]|nr:hypothetical protein [Planctomycetota bacterium]
NDFRFVKGGKLFGVGPSNPRVGGEAQHPQQWSARMMFSRGGALKTYNYHQDAKTYGEGQAVPDFAFEKNRYYRLSFHVKLNDPPTEKNGLTHIYIDGKRMLEDNDLQFRKVNGEKSLIQRLLFNTFHGGDSRAWAPVNDDGSLATVHARYDNFSVYPGLVVR